jgi:transcriptional regulator with XRE-family HTH domain
MSDWGLNTFVYGDEDQKVHGPALGNAVKERMHKALDRCMKAEGISRAEVAHRMSEFLGAKITESYLNQYVSASAGDKQINVARLIAFVQATNSHELIGFLAAQFDMRAVTTRHAMLIKRELLKERLNALNEEIERADSEYRGAK